MTKPRTKTNALCILALVLVALSTAWRSEGTHERVRLAHASIGAVPSVALTVAIRALQDRAASTPVADRGRPQPACPALLRGEARLAARRIASVELIPAYWASIHLSI